MKISNDQKNTISQIADLICQARNLADELQSELFESDHDDLSYFFQYDVMFELENIESAVDEKLERLNATADQIVNLGSN